MSKGTLRGSADFSMYVTGGGYLNIRGYTLHERDGARWVQGPTRKHPGGVAQLISWADDRAKAAFQRAALRAIDSALEMQQYRPGEPIGIDHVKLEATA